MPAAELTGKAELVALLESSPVVAVLGAHWEPLRPAFYVPDYLHRQGYRVLPVNPRGVGRTLWGEPVRGSLAALSGQRIDLVDVFRPSRRVPDHLAEILGLAPLPRAVWLQLGIRHDGTTRELVSAGVDVVQSRCALADHRRWGLGAPTSRG